MKPSLPSLLLLTLLLAACQSNPPKSEEQAPAPAAKPAPKPVAVAKPAEAPAAAQPVKADAHLATGVQFYEDGNYKAAQTELQAALDQGLAGKTDQARARKYLAFIACTANQRDQCKKHFAAAFAAYPKFRLSKAEAGHPIWGPVYSEAKAEAGKKAPAKKR